jgi:phosphoglycerate dehydrogenase-like enzyme
MGGSHTFELGLSSDLVAPDGGFSWGDIGIQTLGAIPWRVLADSATLLRPEHLAGVGACLIGSPAVTADSLPDADDAPALLARFGVGYDVIDLAACTSRGVAVTITVDGSRRPVATAALTLLLATLHRLPQKDDLTRRGEWGARLDGLGMGLTGKTIGCVGLGSIATDFLSLIAPFATTNLAFDPWKTPEEAARAGATLVDLPTLMAESDAVVVMANLSPDNRAMIGRDELALMRSTAVLVNISRGPLVDQEALCHALQQGQLWGAGLDVYEDEPLDPSDPILAHPNVVATPHNLAWTSELGLGMGHSAFAAVVDVRQGRVPAYIVNPEVTDNPAFLEKLARYAGSAS